MAEYDLDPVNVPKVNTKYRKIETQLPVPESLPIFEKLAHGEAPSMWGQPPVIWHKADGFQVSDRWGNTWLDWSSCVVVANAGHGHPRIKEALHNKIDQGLLSAFMFTHESRAELVELLQSLSPDPKEYLVFLLTTGTEATEHCIKLAKTYALENYGAERRYIISFTNAYHGRTMAAQLAGGMEQQKIWTGPQRDDSFINVPFPDGFKNKNTDFSLFLETLEDKGIEADSIAGVITEGFQGVGPDFMPKKYAQALEAFCRTNDIVLILDEVQSGFGRSGKMFTFEHYEISPDLIACGKGITSSLPLSAVLGKRALMSHYTPGSMTHTHSASPLCVEAALANIRVILEEGLVEQAAKKEDVLLDGLRRIKTKYPKHLGCVQGKGLIAGVQFVKPGSEEPDPETAYRVQLRCFHKGLLMFAPVGVCGECLKIAPPLTTPVEALEEGVAVFEEAVCENR